VKGIAGQVTTGIKEKSASLAELQRGNKSMEPSGE